MSIAREGGGVVKAWQDGLGHLFSHIAQKCKGLPGWFGVLFSTFARIAQIALDPTLYQADKRKKYI